MDIRTLEITQEEFKAFIDNAEWKWAKTYADKAPHWYTMLNFKGVDKVVFKKVATLIQFLGQPQKYYSHVNNYLYFDDRKFWHCDPDVATCDLINMTTPEALEGFLNRGYITYAPPKEPWHISLARLQGEEVDQSGDLWG